MMPILPLDTKEALEYIFTYCKAKGSIEGFYEHISED